jgi:hypothetical protein
MLSDAVAGGTPTIASAGVMLSDAVAAGTPTIVKGDIVNDAVFGVCAST